MSDPTNFDYLKLVVATALAVVGWLVANYFTLRRSIAAKRRDLTLEHLINAYRVLTIDVSQRQPCPDRTAKLETLVADVQLFGSPEQVRLVREFCEKLSSGESFGLDPLINEMRDDLRKQLQLHPINGNVQWVRSDEAPTATACG